MNFRLRPFRFRTLFCCFLLTCVFLSATASSTRSATNLSAANRSATDATWKRRQALFSYNRKVPLNARLVSRQDTTISTIERYTIRGAKGDTVPLLFVMPKKVPANTRVPALVVVHGFLGNIDQMLFSAQISANNGYASIIPEIVAHGQRQKPGQDLLGGDINFLHNGIVETVTDIRRSIDFLSTRPRVDMRRVGYVGISLGAMIGTITSAVEPRIKAVGLVVGGGDWKLIIPNQINAVRERDARQGRGGALLRRAQSLLDDVDPKNYASRIAPRPVILLNGRSDTIIPPASARVLYNAARSPKSQKWYADGHFLPPLEVATTLQGWFIRNLKNRR